jgi:phage gp36-like protein
MSAYATTTQLALRAPAKTLSGVSTERQEAAIADASALADDYLDAQYPLPLSTWGGDLTRNVCDIAIYDIASTRGFGAAGDATLLQKRHDAAVAWLERIQSGKAKLTRQSTAPDPSPPTRVSTGTPRGFSDDSTSTSCDDE